MLSGLWNILVTPEFSNPAPLESTPKRQRGSCSQSLLERKLFAGQNSIPIFVQRITCKRVVVIQDLRGCDISKRS